ncbi:hypothetical protein GQX74_002608 [Glossina fuscipes]|nr:hypothetical protein GQX74_002608 [Glossina fuscipes]
MEQYIYKSHVAYSGFVLYALVMSTLRAHNRLSGIISKRIATTSYHCSQKKEKLQKFATKERLIIDVSTVSFHACSRRLQMSQTNKVSCVRGKLFCYANHLCFSANVRNGLRRFMYRYKLKDESKIPLFLNVNKDRESEIERGSRTLSYPPPPYNCCVHATLCKSDNSLLQSISLLSRTIKRYY